MPFIEETLTIQPLPCASIYGIQCLDRGTSCADQLARALKQCMEEGNESDA